MAVLPENLQFTDDFPPIPTAAWEARIVKDLRGKPLEDLVWDAADELALQPYYRSDDVEPHSIPHGPRQTNAWAIRQDIIHPDISQARAAIEAALAQGITSLGFVDQGAESTSTGLPLTQASTWATLLERLDLATTPIHWTCGAAEPAVFTAFSKAVAAHADTLAGSADANPIRDVLLGDLDRNALAQCWDVLANQIQENALPRFRMLHMDTTALASGSPSEQLCYALAQACDTFDALTDRGFTPKAIAQNLHVTLPLGPSFFLEIAKLRACRLLFGRFFSAYGIPNATLFLCGRQAHHTNDPTASYDNLLRSSTIGAAAAIGGCDEISLLPHDTNSPTSSHAMRLVRDLHRILQAEAHLGRVVDPAHGSYYVEALTQKLVDKSWWHFHALEQQGGLFRAFTNGDFKLNG